MPIISENPRELYEALYNEFKSKNTTVSVYLKDKSELSPEERKIGEAIEDFINAYESANFTIKSGFEKKGKNGVEYSTSNYKIEKQNLEDDEKECEKLEKAVSNIRTMLFESVKNRITEIDYEKWKESGTPQEKFAALDASTSDRMGKWLNDAIDKEVKARTENDLEFPHRPEVYLNMKDPKTKQVKRVKVERYVPYTEKFSKEYRFFNRKESFIQYDRKQDPDVYTTAIFALRDILEDHSERKKESDRRREYVKFINNQHQAYAVWKEQMPKEKEKYEKLVGELSEETRKRFNDTMKNYNSMTSLFSGVSAWLEKEKEQYLTYKEVLAEADKEAENAYNAYKEAKTPYEAYLEELQQERTKAREEIETLTNNPILKEEYRKEQEEKLIEYSNEQLKQGLVLEDLEKELQAELKKQKEMSDKIMSITEKANQYREQVLKLRESQSISNIQAVQNYYKILFEGEVNLESDLKEQQDKLQITLEEYKAADKALEEEKKALYEVEIPFIRKKTELNTDERILENVKDFVKKVNSKELKQLQNLISDAKKASKKNNLEKPEQRKKISTLCLQFARAHNWEIGAEAIYCDVDEAKILKETIEENKKQVAELTKAYDEKKEKYDQFTKRLNEVREILVEEVEKANLSIHQFTEEIKKFQNQKSADDVIGELKQASKEGLEQKEKSVASEENEMEREFRELNERIEKKLALKEEKLKELKIVEEKYAQTKKALEDADSATIQLKEKKENYSELVKNQEEKKVRLEETMKNAKEEWDRKESKGQLVEKNLRGFLNDYELVKKKFDEKEISSLRKMEDLAKLVQTQGEKLAKDAEAQKASLHRQESEVTIQMRGMLVGKLFELKDIMNPQGKMKFVNSKEFRELKNTLLTYLEPRLATGKVDDKGMPIYDDNPNCILHKLESLQTRFMAKDAEREACLKDICKAMEKINKVSENYLKAKGDPHRVTEIGRARYAFAESIKKQSKHINMVLSGMLREEEYCKIAPDLSMAVEKSGLETTFEKTDGYKYTKESIKRETDVFDPDVLSHLKKEKKKEEPTGPVLNP